MPRLAHVAVLSLVVALLLTSPLQGANTAAEVVYTIDFTEPPAGKAIPWLRENGYELHLDAEELETRFTDKGLMLSTENSVAGLFARELNLADADRIRVVWGVERYPEGADWENGNYRVPIAVMISFGENRIASGSLFVPDAPYFISLFLSRNAQPGKAYTASYFQKGGRYFCQPCSPPTGETVTTELDLDKAFLESFELSEVPPITRFAFQMNTKDTSGGARAYIKRVEFLARDQGGS